MILLATSIIFVKMLRDERTMCLKEPLVYGVKQIQENSEYPFICECSLLGKRSNKLIVTKDGQRIDEFIQDRN